MTDLSRVARIGYGAMQLGDGVTTDDAIAVLRRAIELGVNHIDTASFYAGGEVNRRIRQALAPYPDDLVIVSKVGAAHTTTGPIPLTAAQKPAELRAAVEADLEQLGIDRIPVVNLRRLDLGPGLQAEGDQIVSVDDQLAEMIAMRDEGKIGAIGISAVEADVVRQALAAGLVCVQNAYTCSIAPRKRRCDCARQRASRGFRSFPSDRRSRASPTSPTTQWSTRWPTRSAPPLRRSGWRGCSPTRRTHC